jgi:hypothetical protein
VNDAKLDDPLLRHLDTLQKWHPRRDEPAEVGTISNREFPRKVRGRYSIFPFLTQVRRTRVPLVDSP